jgi:hypothetical protein
MGGEPTTVAGARYHPGVIWGPFLLALALGLLVSAGLYFAYMWPQVEPEEPSATASPGAKGDEEAPESETSTKPEPASESAKSETDPKVSETEPATEEPEEPPPSKPAA